MLSKPKIILKLKIFITFSFFFLLFSCKTLYTAKDEFLTKSTEKLFQDIALLLPENGIVEINTFDNDDLNIIKYRLSQLIKLNTNLEILDSSNLDNLMSKQLLQEDPAFNDDNKKLIGNFNKAEFLILGNLTYVQRKKFGKKFQKSIIAFHLDDIYSGSSIISIRSLNTEKTEPPLYAYFLIIFFLFIFIHLLNFLTKGYYAKICALIFIMFTLLLSIWFWVV